MTLVVKLLIIAAITALAALAGVAYIHPQLLY